MPKSNLDWLGIVSLWVGALVLFAKTNGFPLMKGAPTWLANPVWGYAPLALVSVYVAIAIYRLMRPILPLSGNVVHEAPAMAPTQNLNLGRPQPSRQAMLSMIDHACQMAEFGLRHGKPKEAEKEWPRMLAALLSAQKEFGIPMPPSGIGALADLRIAEQMLEQVVPLLKAGHDAEAQQVAMSFIGHLKS